ncbi:MAG: hypothetical protein M9899_03455 [Bdellovibrionaceae bacterium]|nr:hypothetical protein [Pseudobdellovibrionaceae bacterium]
MGQDHVEKCIAAQGVRWRSVMNFVAAQDVRLLQYVMSFVAGADDETEFCGELCCSR